MRGNPLPVVAWLLVVGAGAAAAGELTPRVECLSDPGQSYALYRPDGYDPEAGPWPVLLVFDPRGRAELGVELFAAAADERGWLVLSSHDTMSDGPMEPVHRALQAMWDDLLRRYPVDRRRIYAAGFSGGAMFSWLLGQKTGGLAGVVATGGRVVEELFATPLPLAHFGSAGTTDFNFTEMRRVDERFAGFGSPHRFEPFDGPHAWMPEPLARFAVEWLELQAMRARTVPVDLPFVTASYERDLAAARALEASGDLLAASRRFAAVARSFDGLLDVGAAADGAARLEATEAVRRAEADERRWIEWERAAVTRAERTFGRLRQLERPPVAGQLLAELRISELLEQRDAAGPEGLAARRLLATHLTQSGFYLRRQLLAQGDFARLEPTLVLASTIAPERGDLWFDLARARARLGREKAAIEALSRAVETGFVTPERLRMADFDRLRDREAFVELAMEAEAGVGP